MLEEGRLAIHIFKIEEKSIFSREWGEFGGILKRGIDCHRPPKGWRN
jgi:hypothetical protein